MTIYALFLCAVLNGHILPNRCMPVIGSSAYVTVQQCDTAKSDWIDQLPKTAVKRVENGLVSWELDPRAYAVTPQCMKRDLPVWQPAN